MDTSKLFSRRVLLVLAVSSMLVLAGCSGPPSPPNQTEETPEPTPEAYTESGAEVTYDNVYPDHRALLLNEYGAFAVTYNVTINDPRLSSEQVYEKRFLVNTQTEETRYLSNFEGQRTSIYQDSVLYYERVGGEQQDATTTVVPVSDAPQDTINLNEAAGNSSLVSTGMASSSYSFDDARFGGNGQEISTYSSSTTVRNYAVSNLIPESMDYTFGSPSTRNENVDSTIEITKDGLVKEYTFTYTATTTIDGNEEDISIEITYTVDRASEFIEVNKPAWVSNESGAASNTTDES